MINDILIVDSVADSIKRLGIERFRNMVLQEQGGSYFFVDIDENCEKMEKVESEIKLCDKCIKENRRFMPLTEGAIPGCLIGTNKNCPQGYLNYPMVNCGDCTKCVKPIPLKIAWFILQAIRLQRQAFLLAIPPSNEEIEEIFKRLESQEDQL